MATRVLKCWAIGLAIAVFGFLLTLVHTPLDLLGMLLSMPAMLATELIMAFAQSMSPNLDLHAISAVSLFSTFVLGSIFYGAIALVALRLWDWRTRKLPHESSRQSETDGVE